MRILLIGNIANNAYHDAKLLRGLGFDCDVLCADYYHVMGCPEWEDADFSQAALDPFRPDWTRIDLGEFQRPCWFVQGPLDLCLEFLAARDAGRADDASQLWRRLGLVNRTVPVYGFGDRAWLYLRAFGIFASRAQRLLVSPVRVAEKIAELRAGSGGGAKSALARHAAALGGTFAVLVSSALARLAQYLAHGTDDGFERRSVEVVQLFEREFPGRRDRLTSEELWPFRYQWAAWRELLARYDIVQAFAADVAIPLMAGYDYVAFEHGTLRDIPYRPTVQGRLTALGYRCATHTFVTNLDCVDNARQITEGRFTFVNHPYDESTQPVAADVADLRAQLRDSLEASFLIFHPTRHDWIAGHGYADKANDVLFEALRALRRAGCRVGLVCCAWGKNVDASRAWFDAHGLTAHVAWRMPMGMAEFRRYAAASDIVADQFKLGAFGGVTFKSLAVGAVLCTYLDEASTRNIFDELPPILNCRTPEDIEAQVRSCIADPARLAGLAEGSRRWVARYHRGCEVAKIQAQMFRQVAGGDA